MTETSARSARHEPNNLIEQVAELIRTWTTESEAITNLKNNLRQAGAPEEIIDETIRELSQLSGLPDEVQSEAREVIRQGAKGIGLHLPPETFDQFRRPSATAMEAFAVIGDPDWQQLGINADLEDAIWVAEQMQSIWATLQKTIAAGLDEVAATQDDEVRSDLDELAREEWEAINQIARAAALAVRTSDRWATVLPTKEEVERWADLIDEETRGERLEHATTAARHHLRVMLMDAWADMEASEPTGQRRAKFWIEVAANLPGTAYKR